MSRLWHTLFMLLTLSGAVLAVTPSGAQTPAAWPTHPVKFIIPLGPGSGVDITARLLADKLKDRWGQPVIVENRPGGDAFIAITAVTAAHDDHVLLFAPSSTFTAHHYLHDKVPYDIDDLVPIARVTNTLIGVAVPAALNVASLKDFVAKVRAEPGKLNYASVTGANDLLFAAFLKTENLDVHKVGYRDTVQAITDLAENRIQAYVAAYAILRPQVQAGKVKVLALTNRQPAASLPGIPTAEQAGYKSLAFDGLVGLLGPRDMPAALRTRIAADIAAVAADPTVTERLIATGQIVNPGNPQEFKAALDDQYATVKRIGETLGIKPSP